MLAPIITKDMQLFPSRPLPSGIKNVRSRVQSLDQIAQRQSSGSIRGRVVPERHRNSQSVGNLPVIANRSPPKPTLIPIEEGVELGRETASADFIRSPMDTIVQFLRNDQKFQNLNNSKKQTIISQNGTTKDEKENNGKAKHKNGKDQKEKNRVFRWINGLLTRSKSDSSQEDEPSTNSN